MTEKGAKPIAHPNESGARFVMEALAGDNTYAVNLDRIQYHPKKGWIVFEFLKCDTVKPYDSHPRRYWFNWRKFVSLWKITQQLHGRLYLVNYSINKEGRVNREEGIKLIHVLEMDKTGIKKEKSVEWTWEQFQEWFRKLNKECSGDPSEIKIIEEEK